MPFARRALAALIASLAFADAAAAFEFDGVRRIALHTRDGQEIAIGTVTFRPDGGETRFAVSLDTGSFKDFFLSMREFKCVEGQEVQCAVPYPYPTPGVVSAGDLAWLEHSLIFMFKTPAEFGANLWNGLYYVMEVTDEGIVGRPHAVDLNQIAAPPADPGAPPFGPGDRQAIDEGGRWVTRLTIR